MRWSRPPSRSPCASRGTAGSAGSASWSSTRRAAARAEVVDFGPIAPAGLDPGGLSPHRRDDHRAVHLAARRGRPQHARPLVLRDPERCTRLCAGGRALRADAVARSSGAGGGAGPSGPTGRLVGDGEDRDRRRRSAALRRKPGNLAPRRAACGRSGEWRAACPRPRLPRRHAGAARRIRPRRFL